MAGEAYATLATDAKYAPIRAYHAALTSRTSWRVSKCPSCHRIFPSAGANAP